MSDYFNFPINTFQDVSPSDFNKLNKKKVTEDFVSENLKTMGWDVYDPFTDTGIGINERTRQRNGIRSCYCVRCYERSFRNNMQKISVVVSDLWLPKLRGREAFHLL